MSQMVGKVSWGKREQWVLHNAEELAVVLSLIHLHAACCDVLQFVYAWLCGFTDCIM